MLICAIHVHAEFGKCAVVSVQVQCAIVRKSAKVAKITLKHVAHYSVTVQTSLSKAEFMQKGIFFVLNLFA